MNEERLALLLLPGMDGTGKLFSDFVTMLPGWIEPQLVGYPRDQKLSYEELVPILKSVIPSDRPFVVLAESFSTPLAVRFAAEKPKNLRGLVLCAGFSRPPSRGILSRIAVALGPICFSFGLPKYVCRHFLVGDDAPTALVDKVCEIVSSVPAGVLAHRLRSVMTCDVDRELLTISIPMLCIAGIEDRLLHISSIEKLKQMKPDVPLARIHAPHLILQAKPHEATDVVVPFLRKILNELA